MSEATATDPAFGHEAEMAKAGLVPTAVPEPDKTAFPVTEKEVKKKLEANPSPEEDPILKVTWNGDKRAAFKSPEDAVPFLKAARENDSDRTTWKDKVQDAAFEEKIDELRSGKTLEQRQAEERQVIAADRERATQQAENRQRQQAEAQQHHVAQTLDVHQQRLRAAGEGLGATLVAEFGHELASLDLQHLPAAVERMRQVDPQKAQRFEQRLQQVAALKNAADHTARAKQSHTTNQFNSWASQQDQQFKARHGSDANYRAVAEGVGSVLQQFGITPQEYAQLASRPEGSFLRDSRVQSLLYSMSKSSRSAKSAEALKNKVVPKDLPPVVAPGHRDGAPRSALAGAALQSNLGAKLRNATGDKAIAIAAKMLTNRRNAR